MTAPQAAPPPERLPGGEERAGSITLTATVASGRRSTALFGHRDGEAMPVIVRRPTANPARFLADCEEAGGLRVGGDGATADGMPIMPAIVGESLATVLASLFERREPLPIHLALTVAMGIADELLKLGKDGVHGDLVPHHVLIGYDGSVALIDPAASAYLDRAQSAGREGYRSPEHIDADGLTKASDIFVLGILLFEMTTGHPLYAEPTLADNDVRIKAGEMPKPRTLVGDGYPIELQLVLRKMLRPQTSGRFADARAAKDALRLAATSRADVGPDALGQWLAERFPTRRAAWDDLLDATRGRTAPMPVASRAATDETTPPSRAPTALESRPSRPFSLSGIAAEPTVPTRALPRTPSPADDKESPLEVDTFQEIAAVSGPLTMEAIERADAEERSLFSFPSASDADEADEGADDPTAALPRARKRGAGRAAIPGIIPDLPTEVSGRRTPRSDEATMDEASEPTALDEIVESDLVSGSLEALTLEPLPSLQLDDDGDGAPPWQPPLELEPSEETATGDAPGRVLPDVSFDEPAPSTGPSPAPFSAEDFLADDDDDDALPALAADDEAFAPLDPDFLDSLADDTPAPLASADFLDALPRPEDAGFDVDASPNTDRQNAAGALALDDDAPDTFPPDGLLGLDTPHDGVPVAPSAPRGAGRVEGSSTDDVPDVAPGASALSTAGGSGLPAPIEDDHPTGRGSALPEADADGIAAGPGPASPSLDGPPTSRGAGLPAPSGDGHPTSRGGLSAPDTDGLLTSRGSGLPAPGIGGPPTSRGSGLPAPSGDGHPTSRGGLPAPGSASGLPAPSREAPTSRGSGLPAPSRDGLPAARASGLPAPSHDGHPTSRGSGLRAPSGSDLHAPSAEAAPTSRGSGLPAATGSGLPAPSGSGLPAPSGAPRSSGLPSARPSGLPVAGRAAPPDGAVPHGFTDAAPPALALEDELSSDLRLDKPSLDEESDSRDLTSDLWDDDPNEPNDTIDESAAEDILTPDELALVQRAAEIVPAKRDDTVPLPMSPFRAATDPNPNAPTAPLRGATDPSGPPTGLPNPSERPTAMGGSAPLPAHKPRPKPNPDEMSVRPVAPLMKPAESDRPNQRGIATQVVRDRVTDQHGAAIPSSDFVNEGQVPTQVVRERSTSTPRHDRRPAVERDQTPVRAGPTLVDSLLPEDSQNSELVIPLSDDEIRHSERRKRVLIGALVVAPVTILAIGFLAYTQLTRAPTAVSIPSQGANAGGELDTEVLDRARIAPPVKAAPDEAPPPAEDGAPSGVEAQPLKAPPPPVEAPPPAAPPVEAAPPPPVAPPPPIETPPPVETAPPPVEAAPDEATPPPVEATPDEPQEPTKVVVRILPPHAKFEVDGVEYQNGATLEIGADPIDLRAFAKGYIAQRQTIAPFERRNVTVLLMKEPQPEPIEPDTIEP